MSATRLANGLDKAVQRYAWLALMGSLLNGNWEWLQTPLYRDSAGSINEIVWFQLHCTVGDVLILHGSAVVVTTFRWSTKWLAMPRLADLAAMTALGLTYTFWSEYVNLARGGWAYSEHMPLLPGTNLGLAPVFQWTLLPPATVCLVSRLVARDHRA